MPTIREVAAHAGVSPATVSRVVNGLTGYSTETRRRVEEAIREVGYQPNTLARGLKTNQAAVIGVLAPRVSDALAFQVMHGIEAAARDGGYAVMLGRTGFGSVYLDDYLRTLRNYHAAGVILIAAVITPQMRQQIGPGRPMISVAISDHSGSPSVAIDDARAAYDGTKFLLGMGHRRIGLLGGDPSSVNVAVRRKEGYLRAMREAGCTPVVANGTFFYDSAATGLHALLAQDPDLTAVFAVSDEMATGVIHELQRRGRRVPEDVSVLGFDDTPTARHVQPELSTVAQPLTEMGHLAVNKLLHQRDLAPRTVPHRIIARGSTAPPPQ